MHSPVFRENNESRENKDQLALEEGPVCWKIQKTENPGLYAMREDKKTGKTKTGFNILYLSDIQNFDYSERF